MELFKYLLPDMKQPISYIPQGILTGVDGGYGDVFGLEEKKSGK